MVGLSRTTTTVVAAAALLSGSSLSAQVNVSLQWLYPAEAIYLADIAPAFTGGHQPDLFVVLLQNAAGTDQEVVLELSVARDRPSALFIFSGSTDPFTLHAGARRVTNRDLMSRNMDVSIRGADVGDRAESLFERVLETGQLPAGSYRWRVVVRTPQGMELGQGEVVVDLLNPSTLELLAPGRPFGQEPPVVNTPAPQFLWSADAGPGTAGGAYRLRVVQVDAGVGSPEAAMQGFASWESRVSRTAALYPGSVDAMPLRPGEVYAWQVTREVRTSGGIERIESPVYWFRMGSSGIAGAPTGGGEDPLTVRLRELARALGLGPELTGLRLQGEPMLGGQPMESESLERLIEAILAGEITLRQVTIR